MVQRIYIDTSVIGGCFDEEFKVWSDKLILEFLSGQKIAVISDVTIDEVIKDILYQKSEARAKLLKLKKMSRKKFDCVELMRKIRDKHHSLYDKNPALREKRLAEIRKKFGIKKKEEMQASY